MDVPTKPARRKAARHGRGATGPVADPAAFWVLGAHDRGREPSRRAFQELLGRVGGSTGVALFDAVEVGVPTDMVYVLADATGEPVHRVMDIIGVSATTLKRKEEASEPLPDIAGHRVMGLLRVAATLRRLLDESGDPEAVRSFDLEGWLAHWIGQRLPELGGKTPADLLRNPEGQRVVEQVLDRMRGGLPA